MITFLHKFSRWPVTLTSLHRIFLMFLFQFNCIKPAICGAVYDTYVFFEGWSWNINLWSMTSPYHFTLSHCCRGIYYSHDVEDQSPNSNSHQDRYEENNFLKSAQIPNERECVRKACNNICHTSSCLLILHFFESCLYLNLRGVQKVIANKPF